MSGKRSTKAPPKGVQAEQPAPIQAPEEPKPEVPSNSPTQPLTLETMLTDLQSLQKLVLDHAQQIAQLQEALARKRKPPKSNGKVQIKDKQTGKVYPSKNNAYQSLLKAGELKQLVDKGSFGDIPEKNTFGWYVLVREWPDRFEEVKPEEVKAE
ncbi:hypothetical protein ACFLTL_02135 [Chloroflexota bacterium]